MRAVSRWHGVVGAAVLGPGRRLAAAGWADPRNRAAVVEATLGQLALHGYSGLTMEDVGERSGVHKTTVCRRWRGVDGLIVNAVEVVGEDR